MALLERVASLLRANIADLLAKSQDPEKLANQLILDIENQLMQVKTQVAMSIADTHLLRSKKNERHAAAIEWQQKAEAAVAKGSDDLARVALEHALSHRQMEEALSEQLAEQTAEVDRLRTSYRSLQIKLQETKSRVDILAVQLRRKQARKDAKEAQVTLQSTAGGSQLASFGRTVETTAFDSEHSESVDERFTNPEQAAEIEALLLELKDRQASGGK